MAGVSEVVDVVRQSVVLDKGRKAVGEGDAEI